MLGIGSLTCLQTLSIFPVGNKKGSGVEELEHLIQLKGDLVIRNLGVVSNKVQAMKARLCEKPGIVNLELEFSRGNSSSDKLQEDVLESLMPHSNLKGLTLLNYMGQNCPSWMSGSAGNLNCPSVSLSNLVHMKIYYCVALEKIPALSLSNEADLEIFHCNRLKDVAVSSLRNLRIHDCPELANVDFGPDAMTSLQKVTITCCPKTESLQMIGKLSSLEIFRLDRCAELKCLGGSGLFSSTCLKELSIGICCNLISMPSIDGQSSLESLKINNCWELKSIGVESLSSFTCLRQLDVVSCHGLTSIPSLDGLSSLQSIRIEDCQQLRSIGGHSLSASTDLQELCIWKCYALTSVPSLQGVTTLQRLSVEYCELSRFADVLLSSPHLSHLELGGFSEKSEEFPDLSFIQNLRKSLAKLSLVGWSKAKQIPHEIQCLAAVDELTIEGLHGLEALPDWLGSLSSLQRLNIEDCDSLMYMPSVKAMQSLSNLQNLDIINCPECQT